LHGVYARIAAHYFANFFGLPGDDSGRSNGRRNCLLQNALAASPATQFVGPFALSFAKVNVAEVGI
jgi:hypothetical protein